MISRLENIYIYFVVSTVYILAWIMGASLGWSSPMVYKLQSDETDDNPLGRTITKEELSWMASIVTLGLASGAIIFGKLPDFIGRKYTLIAVGLPGMIAFAMFTFTHNVYIFITARFLQGLLTGGFCSVVPLYIGELCHSSRRGFFSAGAMFISRFGFIYSYAVGAYTPFLPYNISLFIISSLFIPLFFLIAPETPYYLIRTGKDTSAANILKKLRGYSEIALNNELEDIKSNAKETQEKSFIHVFKDKAARRAFIIATTLASLEHLTGVNSILMYGQTFFEEAGTSIPSELCPIITSGVQIVIGIIAPLTSDKLGRKILLYMSATGISTMMIVLGIFSYFRDHEGSDVDGFKWLPPLSLFSAVGFFELGYSSLPLVVMAEVFPMNVKCIGQTCVVSSSAVVAFLITKYFTAAIKSFGMYSVVWFFSFMCILSNIFVYLFVEETKGKTLNQIQEILKAESK